MKCRFFLKQMEKHEKSTKELQDLERQQRLEEQKTAELERQDQDIVEQLSQMNLMDEIQRCREELGGPYFNKRENQKFRQQHHESTRKQEEEGRPIRDRGGPSQMNSRIVKQIKDEDSLM